MLFLKVSVIHSFAITMTIRLLGTLLHDVIQLTGDPLMFQRNHTKTTGMHIWFSAYHFPCIEIRGCEASLFCCFFALITMQSHSLSLLNLLYWRTDCLLGAGSNDYKKCNRSKSLRNISLVNSVITN